ncbi:MAG: SLBB domain-containing protein, partial [Candidatus Zixiibacteriota bacterium]
LDRIMLDRISPEDERQVIDLNLSKSRTEVDNMELTDGDILTVFSVYDMKRNVVSINGMVKHPGQFERSDSTTLRTLLDEGELLPQDVYLDRANLFRRYPDRRIDIIPVNLNDVLSGQYDFSLQDLDSLHVYSIDEVKRREYVYIDGEVKRPGKFQLYDNMTLSDLIFLAGDFNKNAYQLGIELARTDSLGRVSLLNIDLSDPAGQSFSLAEDDRVFVRKLPDWFMHRIVTIEGEVQFPGQYALRSKNETMYDLILRAGGFTDNAFPKGTIFRRQTISENLERQNVPEIIANSQPLKEDSLGNIRKVNLVDFNPNGVNRIIIDMDRLMATEGAESNTKLQRNDYIYVPEMPTGISVMGAVGSNGTIKYMPGKNVKYYVERAGNFTNQAYKKGTQLIKADGQVFAKGGTLKKKVELGDVIVVPT